MISFAIAKFLVVILTLSFLPQIYRIAIYIFCKCFCGSVLCVSVRSCLV